MLDAQQALTAAGVPGYRGAFFSTPGNPEPPDVYCAYTYTRSPLHASDDGARAVRVRAFLHLYSRGDPSVPAAAVRREMGNLGFCLIRETEGYEDEMGFYETFTEWEAADYAFQA